MWARWANAILGTWLSLSPLLLSSSVSPNAPSYPADRDRAVAPAVAPDARIDNAARENDTMSANNVITGFVIIACAVAAMFPSMADLRWVNLVAGFWTLISPSVIPHNLASITTNNVIVGILVMLFALVPLYEDFRNYTGFGTRADGYDTTDRTGVGTPTTPRTL
jgi:hypothetical protein